MRAIGVDLDRSVDHTGICILDIDEASGQVVRAVFERHNEDVQAQDAWVAEQSRSALVGVDGPPVPPEHPAYHSGRVCDRYARGVARIDAWPPSRIHCVAARACNIWAMAEAPLCPSPPSSERGLFEVFPRSWTGRLGYKPSKCTSADRAAENRVAIAQHIARQLHASPALESELAAAAANHDDLDALICAFVVAMAHLNPSAILWPPGPTQQKAAADEGWFLLPAISNLVFLRVISSKKVPPPPPRITSEGASGGQCA